MGRLSLRRCVAAGGRRAVACLPAYVMAAALVVSLFWDVFIAILAPVGVGALVEIAVGWVTGWHWP